LITINCERQIILMTAYYKDVYQLHIVDISSRRSTYLGAVYPGLDKLSLPAQWAATVDELDCLAARAKSLERALALVENHMLASNAEVRLRC
jgi:hypothetical protein